MGKARFAKAMHGGARVSKSERQADTGEQFTRLLLENRKRILGFVMSLVPNGVDADDIFQDACAVMWRKFEQFEQGTDFAAWAMRVARYEVMEHWSREKRRTTRLSDQAIDVVLERFADPSQVDSESSRAEAMEHCLERLKPEQAELLYSYYHNEQKVEEISGRLKISIDAVYKRLTRARKQLFECVQRVLLSEETR
ncbi:MAG: sigma-70 family RNA polymerase sigma factor [Pirellulales bacterium]|nr:sigma-70 family RNA polymerase sigma factor [Pirellulales bacterium]